MFLQDRNIIIVSTPEAYLEVYDQARQHCSELLLWSVTFFFLFGLAENIDCTSLSGSTGP